MFEARHHEFEVSMDCVPRFHCKWGKAVKGRKEEGKEERGKSGEKKAEERERRRGKEESLLYAILPMKLL